MLLKQKLPALIGTTLVVAIGIGAYYYFKIQPTAIADPRAAAQVMPASVVMATYITTTPEAWGTLEAFGTPAAQAALQRNVVALQPMLLREFNLSYEQDIRPWINGLMIGVIPTAATDSDLTNPDPSNSGPTLRPLLLLGIRDRGRALRTANRLRTIAGVAITETPIAGVTLTEIATPRGVTYTAILGDFLALSPERAVVEQAIAAYRGEQPTWASQTEVKALLSENWGMETPLIRLYLPDYSTLQPQMPRLGPQGAASLLPFPAQAVQSIALGMGVDGVGLRFQAITHLRDAAPGVDYQPAAGRVLAQFPHTTMALISGQNLTALWSTLVPTGETPPNPWQRFLQQQRDRWGMDLSQVDFGWLGGEFGLGAIATATDASTRGWGGALVLEVADRVAAEATLAQLNTRAAANGYQVRPGTIGDRPVTIWQHTQNPTGLGYGWQDPNFLFIALSGGPTTLEQLALAPTAPLSHSQRFRSLTQPLPSPNAGYLYLDVAQITTLLQLNIAHGSNQPTLVQSPPLLPTDAIVLLNAIEGVGLTLTWPEPTRGEITMIIALKRQ